MRKDVKKVLERYKRLWEEYEDKKRDLFKFIAGHNCDIERMWEWRAILHKEDPRRSKRFDELQANIEIVGFVLACDLSVDRSVLSQISYSLTEETRRLFQEFKAAQ
jgi:hypothetical protein